MNNIERCVEIAMRKFKEEFGEGAKMEPGEAFVTVFNDGVIIVSNEDDEMKVKIIAGEPYKVNDFLGLLEGE